MWALFEHMQVMHAYVDMLEFTDLEFDAAIRVFLAGFRCAAAAAAWDDLRPAGFRLGGARVVAACSARRVPSRASPFCA